jgi:ubiquitin C-terminal hydrolase
LKNTCYINSVIQILAQVEPLKRVIFENFSEDQISPDRT